MLKRELFRWWCSGEDISSLCQPHSHTCLPQNDSSVSYLGPIWAAESSCLSHLVSTTGSSILITADVQSHNLVSRRMDRGMNYAGSQLRGCLKETVASNRTGRPATHTRGPNTVPLQLLGPIPPFDNDPAPDHHRRF